MLFANRRYYCFGSLLEVKVHQEAVPRGAPLKHEPEGPDPACCIARRLQSEGDLTVCGQARRSDRSGTDKAGITKCTQLTAVLQFPSSASASELMFGTAG